MPESTCLHIQDRESGPIRVVELPWISVRIGRAAYCEIRLPDDQIAEEACRLTRRGRTWSLVPATGESAIVLEGRPLDGPCPLPFDVPFRMGPYCLTLRHDVAAEPDWELYPATAPALPLEHREPPDPVDAARRPETDNRPSRDPDRWRARWKAAEAHFTSRAARLDSGGPRPAYSPSPEVPREAERPLSRPSASSSPPVGPPPRPVPTPSAPRIDPIRNVPRPDPKPAAPRLGPALRPAPWSAAGRPEAVATPPYQPPAPASPLIEAIASTDPLGSLETAPLEYPLQAEFGSQIPAEAGTPTDDPPEYLLQAESDDVTIPAEAGTPTNALLESRLQAEPEVPSKEPAGLLETGDWTDLVREAVIATTSAPGFEEGTSFDTGVLAAAPPIEAAPAPPTEAPEEAIAPAAIEADEPVAGATPQARAVVPEAPRPIERGPRRRRPRERMSPGRRAEPTRRSRGEPGLADPTAGREEDPPSIAEVELPSVRDILVNHKNSPGPRPAVERPRRGKHAVPTIPQEPGHWDVPGWLALPPVGIATVGVGLVACVLSWWWTMEATSSAVITQRLMADGSGRRRALPPGVAPSGGRWIRTTAEHLADWAIYTADVEKDEPPPTSEVPGLVTQALEISPLNPTARLAMAQLEGSGRDGSGRIRGLGLSRDSVSLAWSARRLLESGKKEAALRLYSRAISAAVDGGLSRSATPRFAEEPMNRYFLPAEDKVRDIIAELASRKDLPFREWSRALPRNPTVLLATARLLRERGDSQADSLLDDLLGDGWKGALAGADDPRLMAARAEALGLRSRWKEAADEYRQAIERVDNDLIRRSWWFNLADVAQRLNDEGQRQAAFRAVLAANGSDDISRRVGKIQRAGEARAKVREGYGSIKAN